MDSLTFAENELPQLQEVQKLIAKEKLVFRQRGRLRTAGSYESCLYSSKNMVVIEQYCSHRKKDPARSYILISNEMGVLQFYEERMDSYIERSWRGLLFASDFGHLKLPDLQFLRLGDIDRVLDFKDQLRTPFCWAVNRDQINNRENVNCYLVDVRSESNWAQSARQLVLDDKAWDVWLLEISNQLKGAEWTRQN